MWQTQPLFAHCCGLFVCLWNSWLCNWWSRTRLIAWKMVTDTVGSMFNRPLTWTWLPGMCDVRSAVLLSLCSGQLKVNSSPSYLCLTRLLSVTLPFISAASQISGKECSYEFPICSLCVWVTERSTELSDLDSLPGSQLACVALSILPPFLSLPSFLSRSPLPSLSTNILLSVTGLYKLYIEQTFYLEALCEERKTLAWKFLPSSWTSTQHTDRKWDQHLLSGVQLLCTEEKKTHRNW